LFVFPVRYCGEEVKMSLIGVTIVTGFDDKRLRRPDDLAIAGLTGIRFLGMLAKTLGWNADCLGQSA
jgi:hypothetical protein